MSDGNVKVNEDGSRPGGPVEAVGYVRSCSGTSPEPSIERQREALAAYADRVGWTLGAVHEDVGCSSLPPGERPGYGALLAAALRGDFSAVVVERADRVSRSTQDLLAAVDELRGCGVEVHEVGVGRVTLATLPSPGLGSAGGGRADPGAFSDRVRSEGMRERLRAGKRAAARRGHVSGVAYGYRPDPRRRGRRVVDPAEAAVVRRIFERLGEGCSPEAIAEELERSGIPAPRGVWTGRTIRALARNPLYAGMLVHGRTAVVRDVATGQPRRRRTEAGDWTIVQAQDLAIVEERVWREASATLSRRRGASL